MHWVIPQSQGQNLEIKFSKNSTDNLLRLYNNSILRSSRHNNSVTMQSIQHFILVCNSNVNTNLSNNIHNSQSARGPAFPPHSLALPRAPLAHPHTSSRSPRIPSHSPRIPSCSPCALPRTLTLPSCSLALLPHILTCTHFTIPLLYTPHPAPLLACPKCLPTCHGQISQVGSRRRWSRRNKGRRGKASVVN